MQQMRAILIVGFLLVQACLVGQANSDNVQALEYVMKYKDIAIDEMYRTGIPASIKLGQGILESDKGESRLATKANNHFGAKCHNTWFGDSISHDDDAPGECFRKYADPYESYIDHSYVLSKQRYEFLFELNQYDYQSWARGLKKAGYATDPRYAEKLIKIIEQYALFVYDRMEHYPNSEIVLVNDEPKMKFNFVSLESKDFEEELVPEIKAIKAPKKRRTNKIGSIRARKVQKYNGAKYVKYEELVQPIQASNAYQITLTELLDYNYADFKHVFEPETKIYLSKMRKKAPRKNRVHQITEFETMRDVSVKYAVNLASLYKFNQMEEGAEPMPGEIIYLRNHNPQPPRLVQKVNSTVPSFQNAEEKDSNDWASSKPEDNLPTKTFALRASEPKTGAGFSGRRKEMLQIQLDGMQLYKFDRYAISSIAVSPDRYQKTDTRKVTLEEPTVVKETIKEEVSIAGSVFYEVKSGDTLSEIAVEHELSLSELKEMNSLKSSLIKVGQKLLVK